MSAYELRAHIAKLDTEIDLQRELLKKLERDRSLTQRRLNSILDPLALLPLEISSEIFLQTLAPFPEPGILHAPMLLLNICNAWTNIALATPALWDAIHIVFPCARDLEKILPIWLERAQHRPLSVSLRGTFTHDVVDIIWAQGQRLKHLEISEPLAQYAEGEVTELWEGTGPGPLLSLETLIMRGMDVDYVISPRHTVDLLRSAPNLTECLFHNSEIVPDVDTTEILVLPKLRRLMFGEVGTRPSSGQDLLSHLWLPALETLGSDESSDNLFSFLSRSSPPLVELVLGTGWDFGPSAQYLGILRHLRRLGVWYPRCHSVEQFFVVLAESPFLLLRLDTLVMHMTFLIPSGRR
ncbi:hypothetical protein DFH08DRAFT_794879 [Mycena albidolilacea]|uniref:F-box domain-containing protein n=1 Tax=Mycena albidolilacea TaxID=1033008 RepID=A0AAD7E7F3_9AGAR|nr:hypothetical protein DFH08DRAFT_794879 [Mycena albidolilacea]